MVQTYLKATERVADQRNGLTTTHEGGDAYQIDSFRRLRRFLILGSEGGSYYASEQDLTAQNIECVAECLKIDGVRTVDEIVAVSHGGLASKNDPALLALALAASYTDADNQDDAASVRTYALSQLSTVARTGTHLFHFAAYVNSLRGWGSALRKAVGRWYLDRSDMSLVNQVTKYQQRDGWSHADLLRLAHPKTKDTTRNEIFSYIVDGNIPQSEGKVRDYLEAVHRVSQPDLAVAEVVSLIKVHKLPREVLNTIYLKERLVWQALLDNGMPLGAMLRNLGNLGKNGVLTQGSDAARLIIDTITNADKLREARIHPIDALKAKFVYGAGHGLRGSGEWEPVKSVVAALDDAFYASFHNVTPSGKRQLIALDVSGSMTMGDIGGIPGFTPRIASAAMSLVAARVESDVEFVAFTGGYGRYDDSLNGLTELTFSQHTTLDEVIRTVSGLQFGSTNCSLPMRWAISKDRKFDSFSVYTDSETYGQNPSSALRDYRKKSGINDAKMIVVGMVSNEFSIADPTDPNMLDVVGFDSSAPAVMNAFIRGEI